MAFQLLALIPELLSALGGAAGAGAGAAGAGGGLGGLLGSGAGSSALGSFMGTGGGAVAGPMSTPGMTSAAQGGGLLGGAGCMAGGGAQMAAEGMGGAESDPTHELALGNMMADNFSKYGGGPGELPMQPIDPLYGVGKDMSTYANLDSLMKRISSQRRPVQWQPPRRGMLG